MKVIGRKYVNRFSSRTPLKASRWPKNSRGSERGGASWGVVPDGQATKTLGTRFLMLGLLHSFPLLHLGSRLIF